MSLIWQETHQAKIAALLGERLIRADHLRMQIAILEREADRQRWQQFLAMMACGLLIGLGIGIIVSHAI